MKRRFYLIVKADRSTPRLVQRYPQLRHDEIAWRLNVVYPDTYGVVRGDDIDIELPSTMPVVQIDEIEHIITTNTQGEHR